MPGLRQWRRRRRRRRLRQSVAVLVQARNQSRLGLAGGGTIGDHQCVEVRRHPADADALRTLGVDILEDNADQPGSQWQITPPEGFVADGTIDCGLAGTVMRFATDRGSGSWHGAFDRRPAGVRPMAAAGRAQTPGARVDGTGYSRHSLSLAILGARRRHRGTRRSPASSLSGLPLRVLDTPTASTSDTLAERSPSLPHIQMTLAMLRARGVDIDDTTTHRWIVSPGASEVSTPRSSPTFPMPHRLAAAASPAERQLAAESGQAKPSSPEMRSAGSCGIGAEVSLEGNLLHVAGTDHIHGVDP